MRRRPLRLRRYPGPTVPVDHIKEMRRILDSDTFKGALADFNNELFIEWLADESIEARERIYAQLVGTEKFIDFLKQVAERPILSEVTDE